VLIAEDEPDVRKMVAATLEGAGAAVIALGCLVLVGWWLDSPMLMAVIPSLVAMNPTTTAAFLRLISTGHDCCR